MIQVIYLMVKENLKRFCNFVHCRWFPAPHGYRYDPYRDQSDVRHVSAPKTQQTVCVRLSGGGHYHPFSSEQVSRTFYSSAFPLWPSCESYCQNEGEKCRQCRVRSSETTEVIECATGSESRFGEWRPSCQILKTLILCSSDSEFFFKPMRFQC